MSETNEAATRLALAESEANTHLALAEALVRAENVGEAVTEYRSALRLRPALGSAIVVGNLGWTEYLAGHIADSIETSRSALVKDAALTGVRLNLGLSYATLNDWPGAKKEYDLALKVASKGEVQAGITDVRDAAKKRSNPALRKALAYLNDALSKIK